MTNSSFRNTTKKHINQKTWWKHFFFCICGCREKRITPTSTKLIRRTRTGKRVRSKQRECAQKEDTCQGKMADGIWNERPTEWVLQNKTTFFPFKLDPTRENKYVYNTLRYFLTFLRNISFKKHIPDEDHKRWPKHVVGYVVIQ